MESIRCELRSKDSPSARECRSGPGRRAVAPLGERSLFRGENPVFPLALAGQPLTLVSGGAPCLAPDPWFPLIGDS